ncbi:hypothetical protein D9757_004895 [Collybiopsis confluens]|uniref:STB6-like N-terminal domain-containing protein n=1 Tax=Collybiopsis confluens TaxID=2823264 RepID=A0A8H5MCW3_9AGAR|nr:hypothetical protein D9757_004895 [Collybiopsis confluens]
MALSLLLPVPVPNWYISQQDVVLDGYQMYAVDNWILDRKPVPILLVHTGDPAHKITVSALSPPSQIDWDATLTSLRRHAKPRETPYGTLFVTSLAQFRSDYTIVHIPGGNLESARQQLHTNINLMRMGCSGRSGLTLEEPSDTTKDRFISTYLLPDSHPDGAARTRTVLNETVLELVKLIQVSLHIFGYYIPYSFDGLLCNATVDGLRRWVKEVGMYLIEGLEPIKRIADPTTVASLLSLVLAVRNRLVGLSGNTHVIPKDPFLHPRLFTRALASYVTNSHSSSHSSLTSQMMHSMASKGSHSPRQSISHSSYGSSPPIPTSSIPAFLKDHFPQGNASAEATHSHTYSLPVVPTIHSTSASPSHATPPSAPNTSRITSAALSPETFGGTPKLALTIPTPPASRFRTPISSAQPHSNTSTQVIPPTSSDSNAVFPSVEILGAEESAFLTRSVIEAIFSAYDTKLYKVSPEVRRAVRKEKKKNPTSRDDDGSARDALSSIAGLTGVAPRSHLMPGGSLPLASGLKTSFTGTLASSLTGGGYTHSGAATILMPTSDLQELIEIVTGGVSRQKRSGDAKKQKAKEERKDREKEGQKEQDREAESQASASSDGLVDLSKTAKKVKARVKGRSVDKTLDSKAADGTGYDLYKKQSKSNENILGGVGGLVYGLWTGRVHLIVKLREKTEQRERERAIETTEDGVLSDGLGSRRSHKHSRSRPSLWSDGETDPYTNDTTGRTDKRTSLPMHEKMPPSSTGTGRSRSRYSSVQSIPLTEKSDGRSTEEEGPGIGALWARGGSKVRGKLESWTGLSKIDNKLMKHKSNGATLMPRAEAHTIDISPTPSPAGSPSIPSFAPGIPPSPRQTFHSPSSSPAGKKGKLTIPTLGPSSLSPSQIHLQSQPQSPTWNDDDDDLLSSGQVSPIGYGSGFGVDSITEDPRTPKAWPIDYFIKSQAGSAFSSSHVSVGDTAAGVASQKRGSHNNAQSHPSTLIHDRASNMMETLAKHPTRRPWPGNRIPHPSRVTSWSDPISARDDAQDINILILPGSESSMSDDGQASEERLSREDVNEDLGEGMNTGHQRNSTARPTYSAGPGEISDHHIDVYRRPQSTTGMHREDTRGNRSKHRSNELEDSPSEEVTTRKMLGVVPRRRRSFHSLSVYQQDTGSVDTDSVTDDVPRRISIKVLPIDRMRIDVELCGHYLIMWRRADHLRNVIATLQVLTSRLSDTNAHMREHYESHLPELEALEGHIGTISGVDLENANTMKISQATKSLWYEAEQFRVPDLWRIASPPRQKVFQLREKVFGNGFRRLPNGVHGAHGQFDRLQWTLDGRERPVNSEGKSESEVEEERIIDQEGVFIKPPEEDVENIVEHLGIRPMWLLRFFTNWGANRGGSVAKGNEVKTETLSSSSTLQEIPFGHAVVGEAASS